MGIDIGTYFSLKEITAPKTYKITTGSRSLTALEDGEALCAWPENHIFTLHEETGHVMIESSYGHFSYCWPAANRGMGYSLQGFLYGLSFDYFMGKAMADNYMIADIDATLAGYKLDLLRDRKSGHINKEDARDIWERLDEIPSGCFENEFIIHLSNDPVLNENYFDGYPSIRMKEKTSARCFWDNVWCPFREAVLKPYAVKDQELRESRAA